MNRTISLVATVASGVALVAIAACGGNSLGTDGNNNNGSAICGNGVVEGDESCDGGDLGAQSCVTLGFTGGLLACEADCALDTSGCEAPVGCGNGLVDPGEACDGINLGGRSCESLGLGGGDLACTATCQLDTGGCDSSPACGNGQVEAGETCDDGNLTPCDGCSGDCQVDGCGSGVVDVGCGEVCDDGNQSGGDGCSADCLSNESCGNGIVDTVVGEDCDDGNLTSHDGCSSGCTTETLRWTDISPIVNPGGRYGHVTAYDITRDRVVLYGGRTAAQVYYQDTWEFDGTGWLDTTPATTPPGRQFAAMAYDSLRDRMVMFGGRDTVGNIAGTWTYNGSQWVQLPTTGEPSARRYVSMAYDSLRDRMVMFGGYDTETLAETWEFDGTQWNETTPATSPPMRYAYALSYDSTRGVVVMFGGGYYWNGSYYRRGDTWEYNGTLWVETTPAVSPADRSACHSAFDSARNIIVMLGGSDGAGGLFSQTWEYDSNTPASWVDVSPTFGPAGRVHPRLVYDTRRQRTLFYGGNDGVAAFDDTWIYNMNSNWPDEICTSGADVDLDGLTDCADPDCDGQLCSGGTCAAGICQ